MKSATLLLHGQNSADQFADPQRVTAEVEPVGRFVALHLVHSLSRGDRLVARCARLAAAEADPQLGRSIARQLALIDPASDLLAERYIATAHTPPNTCSVGPPSPPRIAGTCARSTEARAVVLRAAPGVP